MISVVCTHCNATIRVKRSKKKTAPTDASRQTGQSHAERQGQAKPTRLPVPEIAVPKAETPDVDEPVLDAVDVPVIKTRRTRKRVSFDGLHVDDADEFDSNESGSNESSFESPAGVDQAEDDSSPNIKVHRSRRKKVARKAKPRGSVDSPKLEALAANVPEPAFVTSGVVSAPESESDSIDQVEVGVDLLPPKFLVADIEDDKSLVLLPGAAGGIQVVDKTEVTVSHAGKTVTLVALEPEELKRLRLIENLVAFAIAGVMLAIALWLVL